MADLCKPHDLQSDRFLHGSGMKIGKHFKCVLICIFFKLHDAGYKFATVKKQNMYGVFASIWEASREKNKLSELNCSVLICVHFPLQI